MPAVRQLQMATGGPRGRSAPGVGIEGASGTRVVVASAMPIEGVRQQQRISVDADEYGDSGKPSPPPPSAQCRVLFKRGYLSASLLYAHI